MPTIIKPEYGAGMKQRWVTTICSDSWPIASITYSVGDVQWDPPLPGTFGIQHTPSFSSQAYVMILNSDPGLCHSEASFRYDIGSCVWNIINPSEEINQHGYTYAPEWATWLANATLGYLSAGTVSPANGNEVENYVEFCCDDSSATAYSLLKTVNTGEQTLGLSISVDTIKHFVGETVASIASAIANVDTGSDFAEFLNNFPSITIGAFAASGFEDFQVVEAYSETCQCSASVINVLYGSKQGGFSADGFGLTIPAAVLHTPADVSLTLLVAELTFSRHGYDDTFNPDPTNVRHLETRQTKRDIHTAYSFIWNNEPKIGKVFHTVDKNGAPGIDFESETTESYICEGESYPQNG